MRTIRAATPVALVILLASILVAQAADRPIAGKRLVLRQTGAGERFVFTSSDPAFLLSFPGGTDDPRTVGATIEIVPIGAASAAAFPVPPGEGNPGWRATNGEFVRYRFANPAAPAGISLVRSVILKEGRRLRAVGESLGGITLNGSLAGVSIRITNGSLRNCARFDAATIRRQATGLFVASRSTASALADCSDASLGILSGCELGAYPACGGECPGDGICTGGFGTCICVSPSSPCGGTSPLCNGTCDSGEECVAVGPGSLPGCVCLPIGSTPCGSPGPPTCGGECPSGQICAPVYAPPALGGGVGCTCGPPEICGVGIRCANGFACTYAGGALCAPLPCGGTYPTCGGSCGGGGECQALSLPGIADMCLCAVPAPCDASCGGYSCGAGEVCAATPGSCDCTPP